MIVTLEPLQFVRLGRSPYESTIAMEGMLTHGEAQLGPSGTVMIIQVGQT